jgi:hypothetical protein
MEIFALVVISRIVIRVEVEAKRSGKFLKKGEREREWKLFIILARGGKFSLILMLSPRDVDELKFALSLSDFEFIRAVASCYTLLANEMSQFYDFK